MSTKAGEEHPLLARVAETDTVIGARLRPGDTTLGEADIEDIKQWVDRTREARWAGLFIHSR